MSARTDLPHDHLSAVLRDVVLYGALSALAQGSGFLLLPVLTRALSTADYGKVDVLAAVTSLLAGLMRWALPSAFARYARESEHPDRLFSSSLAFVACIGVPLVLLLGAAGGPIAEALLGSAAHARLVGLAAWIALGQALTGLPLMALRLERRIVAANLLNLLSTLLYVALAVLLVTRAERGVEGVFLGQAAAVASVLLVALLATRTLLTVRVSLAGLRRSLRFSLPMTPAILVNWASAHVDRLVLLALLGLSSVGVFAVAARLAMVLGFVAVAFREAWHPYSMRLVDDPRRDEIYGRVLQLYAGGCAALGLLLTAVSPELIALLAPGPYREAAVLVPWIAGAVVLHQSASLTNLGVVLAGRTLALTRASCAAAAVGALLSVALIAACGLPGAAIGSFCGELTFTAVLWRASTRASSIRFDVRGAAGALLVYVNVALLLLAAPSIASGATSLWLRVALASAAAAWLVGRSLHDAVGAWGSAAARG